MYFLQWARLRTAFTFVTALALGAQAHAHVHWTRGNSIDPEVLALYHFDADSGAPGSVLEVADQLSEDLGLNVGTPSGAPMTTGNDTPDTFFEPNALYLNSTQTASSTETLQNLTGDLTIEFWFKWNSVLTSQSLEVGLQSGAKLTITRDMANPANDRFGLTFTHGDFISAPGFTNWVDVGDEEASLGEWRHVAVTIHSTGMHYNSVSGHDEYNAGTLARIYWNGHATGTAPHTMDLANMRAHDASKVRVRSTGGQVRIDELTIWAKDWSENGSAVNPFSDGRGSGTVPVELSGISLD